MTTGVDRAYTAIGALSGFVSVAAGAFAAHGLRSRLTPEMLQVFETGARYQMYHALALLVAALLIAGDSSRLAVWAARLFLAGTVLFSGSLYALALTGRVALGAITPFGGVAFLAGWLCLAAAAWRR
ncbi:MAG TPA: DUF423 domain-containing protein [Gemmatimonadales bacterium]|nr:DUF423 domain-containing protein [Gemmatimonadales bacterium]